MQHPSKNNLVVMQGGIGDVLLWIPALKEFRRKPDVIFLYNTPDISMLKNNGLVGETFVIKGKMALLFFAIKNGGNYHTVFLNHLCGGKLLLHCMSRCADAVITNSSHFGEGSGNIHVKTPEENLHDAQQNFFLLHGRVPQKCEFNLEESAPEKKKNSYISIHLAAGNNSTPYKNWPVPYWKKFITLLLYQFPHIEFRVLGSSEECALFERMNINDPRVINLVGKTSIEEAASVISRGSVFIGPDGGLMHLAVCYGVPTFTLWGGSSPQLYGYQTLLGSQHYCASIHLGCGPCNSWLHPNTSKVKNPLACPDFRCMKELLPEKVISDFNSFYQRISVVSK